MSADTDNESDSADSPKRHRGRIPQSAWPQILQRHRAGVTLSTIAREFECTPSAISYIVHKAEAAGVEPLKAPVIAPPNPAPTPARAAVPAAPPQPPQPQPQPPAMTTLSLPDRSGPPKTVPAVAAPTPVAPSVAPPAVATSEHPSRPAGSDTPSPAPSPPTRPTQPPPVDAIEARLRETARACLVAYRGWRQVSAETGLQTLNDAVHDLRKVLARIEIDMSSSRREEQALRPIPIPLHRAARQR